MHAMALGEQRYPGMEHPAVEEILDEAEGKQPQRDGQQCRQKASGMQPAASNDEQDAKREIHADLNRRMLQQTIGSVGPAGFLLADDSEMYERNQRGVHTRNPEWLQLKRGTHRERQDENGHWVADATDELPQRAMWRHYKQLMEA